MKKIGITGGIATGKSQVTHYLRERGYCVIDADEAARAVVEPNMPALKEVVEHFGTEILQADGTLDRQKLGAKIFADETLRHQLNKILHPYIFAWIDQAVHNSNRNLVFIDMPLLLEVGYQQYVDEVWLVYAPPQLQKERLMLRNRLDATAAQARIASQWSIDEKRPYADVILDNQSTLTALYQQVDAQIDRLV